MFRNLGGKSGYRESNSNFFSRRSRNVGSMVGFFSYRKHLSSSDFIIGNRSMNYWLTALAAHASDMSSWLFMGYPAVVFSQGIFGLWTAIGLTGCMFLNWQFIAPKIR